MRLIFGLLILFFVVGCAQISPLVGGERDVFAPSIDTLKSYPKNGQLNYTNNTINLKFNEFIKLNIPNDNIVITPQLKTNPTITVKNKRFKLTFNENLKQNTTYVINFNGAIQDITEKNDSVFQYVFSTGNYIDSLSISGFVKDAYTNKAVDKCFIAIYPKTDTVVYDSIPYKIKPTYIGQTNKLGFYKISYLKQGNFYVFAFKDINKNMLFNSDTEKIGFLIQKNITLNNSKTNINFRLSKIESDKTYLTKTEFTYPGKLELVFNKPPQNYNLKSNVPIAKINTNKADSLIYYVMQKPTKNVEFYLNYNNKTTDTLKPYFKNTPSNNDIIKLKIKTNIVSGQLLLPNDSLIISITEPINSINIDKFHFLDKDSNEILINYKIINLNQLIFNTYNKAIYLQIDSLAIESVYGNYTHNKVNYKFENLIAEDYYGMLILNTDTLTGNFIFELLDNKQNVIQTIKIKGVNTKLKFKNLQPGKYQLRAIKDNDDNGKWSKGSIKNNTQAEQVYYYTDDIKIKSKWDLEIEWKIKSD